MLSLFLHDVQRESDRESVCVPTSVDFRMVFPEAMTVRLSFLFSFSWNTR